MTCQQHVFTPWIDIPVFLDYNTTQTRRCQVCGMSAVRVKPRSWVVPHPRDVYDEVDYDYDVERDTG